MLKYIMKFKEGEILVMSKIFLLAETGTPVIQSVDPGDFARKIGTGLYAVYQYLQVLVIPLALVVMGVSALMFIGGILFHSGPTKRIGLSGVFMSLFGLFFFWGIPILIGVAQAIHDKIK